ncbi:hypothetical protein KDA_75220 [Dictyobacter alpinus]|uniref:Uncharacterized protein n=1 Tax=Dictyobacter alpinus TaxID=2014873 RepID=A0A402BKZ6_9CHLR|nr:hypothetical protein [Dictyobacter alpinus]GCE32038.1 hypothetical protein KDA_75220 [Dictyobacter alpinus]
MTTSNQQNPFLTTIVSDACDQARVYYLDTVQKKQQFGGTPTNLLEQSLQEHRAKLEMWREEALRAAFAGDVQNASIQLAFIVTGWSLYKADKDLINADTHGLYLDAANPDTVVDFVRALQHSVAFWATELQNKWIEGDQQRKANQANIYMERNERLYGVYHQMVQDQGSALHQAHQYNREYAQAALDGVRQAQQGAQWMMAGVERLNQQASQNVYWYQQGVQGMYTHGVQVMQAAIKTQQEFNQNLEQSLPREMEKAQARIERRKILTRGIVALVMVAAVPLAIGLAWFLLRLTLGF